MFGTAGGEHLGLFVQACVSVKVLRNQIVRNTKDSDVNVFVFAYYVYVHRFILRTHYEYS